MRCPVGIEIELRRTAPEATRLPEDQGDRPAARSPSTLWTPSALARAVDARRIRHDRLDPGNLLTRARHRRRRDLQHRLAEAGPPCLGLRGRLFDVQDPGEGDSPAGSSAASGEVSSGRCSTGRSGESETRAALRPARRARPRTCSSVRSGPRATRATSTSRSRGRAASSSRTHRGGIRRCCRREACRPGR